MNKEQKQIIKQWREVNNQYMNNKRYEEKAELQDSNKARMYEEKKKQIMIHRDETENYAWQDICDYLKVDPKKTVCLNFEFKNFKSYTKKQYKKETGDDYYSMQQTNKNMNYDTNE